MEPRTPRRSSRPGSRRWSSVRRAPVTTAPMNGSRSPICTADMETMSVGRDGASDAASFIEAGIPAVEFGPAGAGHHGPDEWVSISSLARYRRALADFVRSLPIWLQAEDPRSGILKSIEGGFGG